MDTFSADIRFALRMLRRTPGVTAAAVLTLALAIGANTAIFSVVDGVLLRPLPFADSARLVVLNGKFPAQQLFKVALSVPELKDVRQQSRMLGAVGGYGQGDVNLGGAGAPPERVCTGVVTASVLPMLGVQPLVGRNFSSDEEIKGNDRVALLAYGLWQRRFGGDGGVVGKEIVLDNLPYRVVGVLPPGFQLGEKCELWVPLSTSIDMVERRGAHWVQTIARLKPGATGPQLSADLAALSARLVELYPRNYRSGGWSLEWRPLLETVVGDVRLALMVLVFAVAFVLLIACANVANLMLARAAARQREMAIRAALGAGRGRLIRQLLTESVILSLAGGVLGLLLATWGLDAIMALSPDTLPRAAEVTLDGRVLAFTLVVTLVTGVIFGLAPALAASRLDLNGALKEGGRGASASRGRLRQALVVAEVALSLVLLVGTGLMLRSFLRLRDVRPGIRPEHVLTLRVSLPTGVGAPSDEERQRWVSWFERAATRLGQLPGVEAVGAANLLPFDGNSTDNSFEIEGYTAPDGASPDNELREATPGYFEAMGMTLVRGRFISAADSGDAAPVVVINQAMAQRYWHHGEDPIGRRLRIHAAPTPPWSTVVGIVGDVRGFGLDAPAKAEMYFPHAQMRRSSSLALVLRASGDPARLAPSVRAVMNEVDAQQAIYQLRPMTELLAGSLAQRRFSLVLMLLFAGVALLLAAVGIYGVMAYTVAQRTHEIGIRVALGARPADVLVMVVRDGMRLCLYGVALGLLAALALTRLVASLLYGVSATDAGTYGVIAAVLAGVALVAVIIPARRATRVDPLSALRAD